MNNSNHFFVSHLLVVAMLLVAYAMFGAAIYLMIAKGGYATLMLCSGSFMLALWLVELSDMLTQRIHNQTFWLMSMCIVPLFAMAVYPFVRKRLISKQPHRMGGGISKN